MSDLPKGWTETTIREISENINYGFTAKASQINNGVKYLRITDIQDNKVDWETVPFCEISENNSLKYLLEKGDVVFARTGATTGKSFLIESCPKAVFASYLIKLRATGAVLPKFVAQFFQSHLYWQQITENISGSAQPNCNASKLSTVKLLLPPLNEQKRIVEKLEKLLGKVEAVQARLDKIPAILKRFRQAVLAAACSGKLTADWRLENPKPEPASELFLKISEERKRKFDEDCRLAVSEGRRKPKNQDTNKKSRNTVSDLPEIPDFWQYFRLEEISYLVTDGTHHTPIYISEGTPFLSVKNVRPFLIRDKDIKFISKEQHKEINQRCNPEKGDILYTKVGATYGYAAVNNLDYDFSIFVSLALIKPVPPFFDSKYAELVINSEVVFSQARERVTGIGTPDLHLIEIRDFRIPLPPLEEQKEIVRRVEDLFKFADQIEARYKKARSYTDKLTQSILAKAFRGELVPQDETDEPASVLLERIKARREETESQTKNIKQIKAKTKNAVQK